MGNGYVPVLYSHGVVRFITKKVLFQRSTQKHTGLAWVFCVSGTSAHVTVKKEHHTAGDTEGRSICS